LGGANTARLRSPGRFVRTLADPWIIVDDWNAGAAQLEASDFLQFFDGVVKVPDAEATCTTAAGTSRIDHPVIKRGFEQFVSARANGQVPAASSWRLTAAMRLGGTRRTASALADWLSRGSAAASRLREAFDDMAGDLAGAQPVVQTERAPFHIGQDVWEVAEASVRARALLTAGAHGDARAVPGGDGLARISQRYAAWVSTVEETLLQAEQADDSARRHCRGRAEVPSLVWARLKPSPGRAHMRSPVTEWRRALETLVVKLLALKRHGADEAQQDTTIATIDRMVGEGMDQPREHIFGRNATSDVIEQWQLLLHVATRPDADVEDLELAAQQTQERAQRAFARSLAAAGQAFVRWAQDCRRKTPGAVHRHAKGVSADLG
ncbi:unnamed protein product, partial [Prorocentrum cordatum]